MICFEPAALSACALVFVATISAVSAEPRPARGGHLLGPDMAALAAPPRIASARPARGGHTFGADMAAARKPIQPRATAAKDCGAAAPCGAAVAADE